MVLTTVALIAIFSLPAFAGEHLRAVPYSSTLNDVNTDNLKQFIETFFVVKKENGNFMLERPNNPDIVDWLVEFSIVPQRVTVSHTNYFGVGDYEYYEVELTSFLATFDYRGSQASELLESGIVPVIREMVRVKLDLHRLTLNKEQGAMLVNSVKTKQPVHLKGKLLLWVWGPTLKDLRENLRHNIKFVPSEINGTPVKEEWY